MPQPEIENDICETCGKRLPGGGSLTQWLGMGETCQCQSQVQAESVPPERNAINVSVNSRPDSIDSQEIGAWSLSEQEGAARHSDSDNSQDFVCERCGLHTYRSTGSLTQWALRGDGVATMCSCEDNAEVVGRHYQVISCLGRGGMSVVYKARHQFLDNIAAVKMLSPDRIADAKATARFQQEAKSASLLSHPGIVGIREFGIDENKQPFLVMDYVEGRSLADMIDQSGPLEPKRAVNLFLQTADALEHSHKNGVVHRDLKPNNIIVIESNDAEGADIKESMKVVDFGIAKLNDDKVSTNALTQTGEVFGSPYYMSPEQCKGQALDGRSDIYSLGCSLYEAITGDPPAKSDSVIETLMIHVNGFNPEFETTNAFKRLSSDTASGDALKCFQGLALVVRGCTRKLPGERYQKMSAVKADLERIKLGHSPFGPQGGIWDTSFIAARLRRVGTGRESKNGDQSLPELAPILVFAATTLIVMGIILYAAFGTRTETGAGESLTGGGSAIAGANGRTADGGGGTADANGRTADANGRTADANERTTDANGRIADANGRPADANGRIAAGGGGIADANGRTADANECTTDANGRTADGSASTQARDGGSAPPGDSVSTGSAKSNSGESPATARASAPLRFLKAAGGEISGSTIIELSAKGLEQLKSGRYRIVELKAMQVTDSDLADLSENENITSIDLSGSSGFTDRGISYLDSMSNLINLNLAGTDVTDASIEKFARLPLVRLDVAYTLITDKAVRTLLQSTSSSQSRTLKWLSIKRTKVSKSADKALIDAGFKKAGDAWIRQ